MCPVRNSPILSETSAWAEWFLYLVICKKKKPIFTTLGMHRLLSPAVRLSPHTRESRVRILTLASLLVFISFSFCFPFFLSITLTNPWALERFCSLPLHIFLWLLHPIGGEATMPSRWVIEWVSVTIEYEWALPTLTRLLPDISRMCSASACPDLLYSTAKKGDVSTSQLAMQEGSCRGD